MKRTILAGFVLSCSAPAFADVSTVCGGKYAAAAEVIDNAYFKHGALYSGGDGYWSGRDISVTAKADAGDVVLRSGRYRSIDNVGATINAYRVMIGLEPLPELAKRYVEGGISYYELSALPVEEQAKQVAQAAKLMTEPDVNLDKDAIGRAARLLDIATMDRPTADWWLRYDDDFSDYGFAGYGNPYYGVTRGIKPLQKAVAKLAETTPALDWLLANLNVSRTARLTQYNDDVPKPAPKGAEALKAYVKRKAFAGRTATPYAALLKPSAAGTDDFGAAYFDETLKAVEACTAAVRDYAILIGTGRYVGDAFMPRVMLDRYLLRQADIAKNAADFAYNDTYYDDLTALAKRSDDTAPYVIPLLYASRTKAQMRAALDFYPKAGFRYELVDIELLLPLDILEDFAPGSAFARHIALKNYDAARRLLEAEVKANEASRDLVNDILAADIPNSAAMPLAALRFNCLSFHKSGFCHNSHAYSSQNVHRNWFYHRDALGVSTLRGQHCGAAIARKLFGDSQENYPQSYRAYRQCKNAKPKALPPLAILGPNSAINRNRLKQFNGPRRLSRALSEDMIMWAKTAPQGRFKSRFTKNPNAELMAEGLRRVIYLNRHESGGDIDGVPAGKRAFDLLKTRLRRTDTAKRTRYFFNPRHD